MTPRERISPVFIPHVGCPNLCSFCNQRTIAGKTQALTPENVTETIETALAYAGGVAEVAFYGGSFTCIARELQAAYLKVVAPFLEKGLVSGIRISTRPDAVGEDVLDFLWGNGVKTIELGAQSMVDGVLLANNRGHLSRDTREGAGRIKARGFRLGLQMMTGLRGDTPAGAVETARDFVALGPDFVRIYPTVVLPGTDLANAYGRGEYLPQTLEEAVDLTAALYEIFSEANIRVIRMGLHTDDTLGETVLAGPYHPAFGELVYASLYRKQAEVIMNELDLRGKRVCLVVAPGDISKMTGQQKSNIKYLTRLTGAAEIRVATRKMAEYEVCLCI